MRNLAAAMQEGKVKHLDGIRAKTHIETLDAMLRQAKRDYEQSKGISYSASQKRSVSVDDIDAMSYPYPTFHADNLRDIARAIEAVKGGVRLAQKMRKIASQTKGDRSWGELKNAELREAVRKAATMAKKHTENGKHAAENTLDRFKNFDRLQKMGITDLPTLRAAMREYLEYKNVEQKADPLKQRRRELIGRKDNDFFPTPQPVIDRIMEEADIQPGMSVLEPSAGFGDIAQAAKDAGGEVEVVEISPTLREYLKDAGFEPTSSDFLEHTGEYDRIVMNPPFSKRQDVDHVRHAFSLLKPGGKLVAITSEGPFFGSDAKAKEFRDFVDEHGSSEKLPEGAFKSSFNTTGVNTRIVVIEKQDDSALSLSPQEQNTKPKQDNAELKERVAHLEKTFGPIVKSWKNAPEFEVVATQDDLPADIRRKAAGGQIRGAYVNGKVYLVAENLNDTQEGIEVLLHEAIGHYGLRQVFGGSFNIAMNRLYAKIGRAEGLAKLGEELGIDLAAYQEILDNPKLSVERRNEIIMDEFLAHLAEQGREPGLVQRVVAAIRKGLRKLGLNLQINAADLIALVADAKRQVIKGERSAIVFAPDKAGISTGDVRHSLAGSAAAKLGLNSLQNKKLATYLKTATPQVKTYIDYLRMKLQDKFIPLKRVQELLEGKGWAKTEENDAYRAEELYHGKATKRLEDFYDKTVKPLIEKINSAEGIDIAEVEEYLYAKYAPERNAHIASINPEFPDGGSGMSNAESKRILRTFEQSGKTGQLEEIAAEVRAISQMQRDIIRDEGLEVDDTIDAWEVGNENYVPLKGGKDEKQGKGIGTGFNVRKSGTKQALGRKSKAENILAELFSQVGSTIVRAEKAKVGRAFLRMVEENPSDMWKIYDPSKPETLPTKRKLTDNPDVKRIKKKLDRRKYALKRATEPKQVAKLQGEILGLQLELQSTKDKVVRNILDMSGIKEDNVMAVTREDGSVVYVEMQDKDLARVMNNLTEGQQGKVTKALAKSIRYLSMASTSLNPEFVVTNFERDIQTAMVHLGGENSAKLAKEVLKSVPGAWRGIRAAFKGDTGNEWAQWFERYQKAGAQVSFMDLHGAEDWQRKLAKTGKDGWAKSTRENFNKVKEAIDT